MTEYMNTIMPIKGNTCELYQNIRYSSNFTFILNLKFLQRYSRKSMWNQRKTIQKYKPE